MRRLQVPANGTIEVEAMLGVLKTHTIPGGARHDDLAGSHTRLLTTSAGPVPVTAYIGEQGVEIEFEAAAGLSDSELTMVTREWLDLDADTAAITAALAADPIVGPLALARPGVRVVKCLDAFEATITTVLGQQVSLAACRTFSGRLLSAYGTPGPGGLSIFPEPGRIADLSLDEVQATVGLTTSRARTVLEVAAAFVSGLKLRDGQSYAQSRADLLAIRGIGPWSADYLAVRLLGDPDAFAPGDLVARRALRVATELEAAALGEAWHPWRSYALFHLWTAQTYL